MVLSPASHTDLELMPALGAKALSRFQIQEMILAVSKLASCSLQGLCPSPHIGVLWKGGVMWQECHFTGCVQSSHSTGYCELCSHQLKEKQQTALCRQWISRYEFTFVKGRAPLQWVMKCHWSVFLNLVIFHGYSDTAFAILKGNPWVIMASCLKLIYSQF